MPCFIHRPMIASGVFLTWQLNDNKGWARRKGKMDQTRGSYKQVGCRLTWIQPLPSGIPTGLLRRGTTPRNPLALLLAGPTRPTQSARLASPRGAVAPQAASDNSIAIETRLRPQTSVRT